MGGGLGRGEQVPETPQGDTRIHGILSLSLQKLWEEEFFLPKEQGMPVDSWP